MQWLYNIYCINGRRRRGQNRGLMLSGEVSVGTWSHDFAEALWMLIFFFILFLFFAKWCTFSRMSMTLFLGWTASRGVIVFKRDVWVWAPSSWRMECNHRFLASWANTLNCDLLGPGTLLYVPQYKWLGWLCVKISFVVVWCRFCTHLGWQHLPDQTLLGYCENPKHVLMWGSIWTAHCCQSGAQSGRL